MQRRTTVAVAGVAIVAAAIWFASGWIADAPDETCASVFQPGTWWDRDGCTVVMTSRSVAAVVMAAVGLIVVVFARRDRVRPATRLASVGLGVAVVALVVNEAVREGGLLASR